MIELTEVVDPYEYRYEGRKTFINLDNANRVTDFGQKGFSIIYFNDGSKVVVGQSVEQVNALIRQYAEDAQKERFEARFNEAFNKLLKQERNQK